LSVSAIPESSSHTILSTDIVPTTQNAHPMITRSKHGIYIIEPPSFVVASKHPQWVVAMDAEFQSLQKQNTWSLVPFPPHKNVVTCKRVYKLKRNNDGSITRYKARLVARGYLQ